jgi:tetraacyldisaccharide 4'-kinase
VVTRRYRPGPDGFGDEELLYRRQFGDARVFAGDNKRLLARAAAAAGAQLILVDDGFSHWGLERDVDVVLIDRTDRLGGGQLLPAGRLREPIVALQRASIVVWTRLRPDDDAGPMSAGMQTLAPAALIAAARHEVAGVRWLNGGDCAERGPGVVMTGTGNPLAVLESAREAGFGKLSLLSFPDHHWFTASDAAAGHKAARDLGGVLILSPKDDVRWPSGAPRDRIAVLEPRWTWVRNGDAAEAMVWDADESKAVLSPAARGAGTRA